MSDPLLVFDAVSKTHRRGTEEVHALVEVDLEIHVGDFVVVTGPSGAGKSTLLHVGAGLEPIDAGRILVGGDDLTKMSERNKAAWRCTGLGYVFQFFHLVGNLSAVENVAVPLLLAGVKRGDAEARASEALGEVGLGERLDHTPAQLSGGQMQRVAVARALVTGAPLLFADEPTGNLDSASGAEVLELLRRANRERGCAVVLVTHDPGVQQDRDRLVNLQDGPVVDHDGGRLMAGTHDALAAAPDVRTGAAPGSEFAGVDLGVLRYSRVWEDHRLLDEGLALDGDSHVLSISSAGCNVLALLLHEPAAITAVDLSPTEAALLELQLAAIAHLDAPSVRVLLGVAPTRSDIRLGCYAALRPKLSRNARLVWDARVDIIGEGLAWAGRLERYMHSFTRGPLVELVPDERLRELFTLDVEAERQAWADRWLRTPEVEASFRVFASRERMAADGRSPEQFAWVRDVDVDGGLWERFQRVCTVLDTRDNHYLRGFLLADLDACWPDALTDEGQDRIRPLVDRVRIHVGDLARVLDTAPPGTFSHANLSDIFEYLSPEETTNVMNSFGARLRDGGRLAFWNLFVDRKPVDERGAVRRLDELSDRLWLEDRSWFYGGFHVAEVGR